jgi:uncharacterized membrane protein
LEFVSNFEFRISSLLLPAVVRRRLEIFLHDIARLARNAFFFDFVGGVFRAVGHDVLQLGLGFALGRVVLDERAGEDPALAVIR